MKLIKNMAVLKFKKLAVIFYAIIFGFFINGHECKIVQFIFGDSLSDVGNNDNLAKSLARASLPWYGIDFGNGLPNGRFSNGRTVADIIGDHMGLARPPAFLDPSLSEDVILQNGVNFASGGGGILNETGSLFNTDVELEITDMAPDASASSNATYSIYDIQRFGLYKQIELFRGTQELVGAKIGNTEADKFFQEARYVVALGSNDFINNYLMPVYSDSWTYSDDSFNQYLMQTLQNQLTVLHGLGARKLMVFGLGPMGCIPLQRVLSSSGECQERTNNLALSFNEGASKVVANLSNHLPNATFKFGDAYDVVNDLINNPNKYGFSNSDSPCCSFGKIRPALTCVPASTLCKDRSKYVFWDEYHPSDSANQIIANELIKKLGFKPVNQTDP